MTPEQLRATTLADLSALLEALDRRLPRLAHIDEPAIAKDAAELRERAQRLIARLDAVARKSDTT